MKKLKLFHYLKTQLRNEMPRNKRVARSFQRKLQIDKRVFVRKLEVKVCGGISTQTLNARLSRRFFS